MAHTERDIYVSARTGLLDALDALEAHRGSLVLIGAQAIYLHTGEIAGTGIATTTDADLVLDADLLSRDPELATTLEAASFERGANPGAWVTKSGIGVDLMVALHHSGRRKPDARAAHLEGHDTWSARPASGLEAALIDHSPAELTALDPADKRSMIVDVAGPASLLVAKCIKIEERALQAKTQRSRLKTKDAVDVLRLLVAVDTGDLVAGLRTHAADEFAAPVSERALRFLSAQRSGTQDVLADLVDRQLGNPRMVASYEALADDLLAAVAEADLTV